MEEGGVKRELKEGGMGGRGQMEEGGVKRE